uniref:Uncharacterized protein n=1 Tax=Campylobacter coli TaxID=195 RepID=I3RJM1_CAMCO|nr:hypothetical protein [Campylobacter coli]
MLHKLKKNARNLDFLPSKCVKISLILRYQILRKMYEYS